MPDASFPLLERGVYRSPALGPNGEIILFAVDHRGRWLGEDFRVMLPDENHVSSAKAALWNLLDTVDAEHARRRARRPRQRAG